MQYITITGISHTIVHSRSVGRNTHANNFRILYSMNAIQVPLHSSHCFESSYIKHDVPVNRLTPYISMGTLLTARIPEISIYNSFTIIYTHVRNGTLLLIIIVTWDNSIHVI